MDLCYSNMPPFPRINRFTALDWFWIVQADCSPFLYEMAVFRWELGLSNYKSCQVVFVPVGCGFYEGTNMAAAKQAEQKTPENGWKGFINVELTEQDKTVVSEKWQKAKYTELLPNLVDVGKVSISFNPSNNTYNCSVLFYHEPLKGYCVSSFAPSPLMAVFIAWYKLDVYADNITPDNGAINRPSFG